MERLTTAEFIEKARVVHGDKYDYSKVKYTNNSTKVCIICPEHGEFWQTPNKHLSRQGCKLCARNNSANKRSKTTEKFIEEVKKVHGDKYDYSKVEYVNNHTKICVICRKHGEFWILPYNHLIGQGCNKCANILKGQTRRLTKEQFIERAKMIHGNKYDYSKVEYNGCEEKVCIICPEHGEFWQTPHMHISKKGRGCPMCSGTKRLTTAEFIEKAKSVHGSKYDYSKVEYKNNKRKVCIICPKHGEFWQTPNSHLNGTGCPSCSASHLEKVVSDFLIENGVKYIKEKVFKWLNMKKFDFYLPESNVAIECQGEQHFKPIDFGGKGKKWAIELFKNNKQRDEQKIRKCKENGIKLIHYNPFEKYFGTYENEVHNMEELEKLLLT